MESQLIKPFVRGDQEEAPLVSVIIPAYNHENYIEETLGAFACQIYQNIELIVLDDGSSDGTFVSIQRGKELYGNRFKKFIAIRGNHFGLKHSLNLMIGLAEGKYVFPCASDDVPTNDAIKILVNELEKDETAVLAVGNNAFIDEDSRRTAIVKDGRLFTTQESNLNLVHLIHTGKFGSYSELLKGNHIPNGYLIRRKAIEEAGEYSFMLEDWGMNLQLAKLGKLKYLSKILFFYRLHSKNTIKSSEYLKGQKEFYKDAYRREFCYNFKLNRFFKYLYIFSRFYLLRFYTPLFLKKILRQRKWL